uniref:Uncharacterized protein n=3 Tax=viral metagenome TaxID=1070528 RepID=A0A6M3XW23_9ZZZZ
MAVLTTKEKRMLNRGLVTSEHQLGDRLQAMDTDGANSLVAATDLTSTTAASFSIGNINDATKVPLLKLSTTTLASGAYTVTLQPEASAWAADRAIYLPNVGADDTLVSVTATQTLTNKTLTTPTIANFTNATHDHSTTAQGGTLSISLATLGMAAEGTLETFFDVGASGATGVLRLQATGGGTDNTVTLTNTVTTQDVTLTLPDGTGTLVATGQAITGYISLAGTVSGGIKIAPIATGTALATIQNQNVAASTITLPSATCTLPGLGLTNSFSVVQTVAFDDTTDGVVDPLVLTHSSSDNNATAGDGVSISFKLENATGTSTVEEWASIDVLSTTITNGSEDGDIVFNTMLAGTVTAAVTIDASAQELVIGRDATDANGLHGLRIWPLTAAKGSILIQPADNTGDDTITITNGNTGGDITITLPTVTCTLVGTAASNIFSAAQNVTRNDTTDGLVDGVVLTHSSSDNNATVGDGISISLCLENATGTSAVEEWARMDALSTTITNGSEDGDIAFSTMLAGTVTQAALIDASDQSLTLGRNSTDANGVYQLRIYPVTTGRGSLILQAVAHASADRATTIVNATDSGAAVTVTLPNATCTLPGVGLANTFSAVQGVTIDDASNTAVTDLLVLTHTTSGAPGAGIGAGISVIVENDTDATTEVSSLDFVTTNDGTKAALDTDIVFKTMLAGTLSQVVALDASAQELIIGASAASADQINAIRIYANTTAARGSLLLKAQTHASDDYATTLQNATDLGAAATITLPSTTCTLPGLGLANTFTATVSVTKDDTTDGVVDGLILTHSSSDNAATAADGVSISFCLENATGTSTVEEWARLDAVSTTITDGSEDGDVVLSTMLAGTVTEALRLDASDQSLSVGQSATDANGINKLRVFPLTAASGSLVLQAAVDAAGDHATTITNATDASGAVTVTLPSQTCTLPGLGVANTFGAVQGVTVDDASNAAVTDLLVLTHTTSGAPGAGIGAGISVIVENDTDATTEVSSIDFVTTSDGTKASLDTDIRFTTRLAGISAICLLLDASDQSFTIGRSSTHADGLYRLRIFPLTASKGSLILAATANTADYEVSITNAAHGQATALTIPDCGSATANLVLSEGAATVNGAKTFGTMPIIPTATVAALGANQGDAAAITTGFTLVSGADATKGVKLPAAAAGLTAIVVNNAAAVLKVWPNTDDAINGLGANNNIAMAANTAATYVAYDATTWYTIPTVPS